MGKHLLPFIVVCLILNNAFAGTPTPDGLDADVYSILITPETTITGTHPEVMAQVQNKSALTGKYGGKAIFDVKVIVILPDRSKKEWWWNDVSFLPNQKKAYPLGKEYDISQPGRYQIEFSVYDSSRKHLISSISKTFTVKEPVKAPSPIPAVKEAVKKPQPPIQKTAEYRPERRYIGIGGFANIINFSGGSTLILWPLKNLAIQAFYGTGTFASYEIRGFYRFDLSRMFKPYLGAGYLHAERDFQVTSSGQTVMEGTIKGDSYTAFAGVEISLIKDRLSLYLDVSGTPLKLEDDVMIGADKVKVSVDYSPVTLGTGLVFYIW